MCKKIDEVPEKGNPIFGISAVEHGEEEAGKLRLILEHNKCTVVADHGNGDSGQKRKKQEAGCRLSTTVCQPGSNLGTH